MTLTQNLIDNLKTFLPRIQVNEFNVSKEFPGKSVSFSLHNYYNDFSLITSTLLELVASVLLYELKSSNSIELMLSDIEVEHDEYYSSIKCIYRLN